MVMQWLKAGQFVWEREFNKIVNADEGTTCSDFSDMSRQFA